MHRQGTANQGGQPINWEDDAGNQARIYGSRATNSDSLGALVAQIYDGAGNWDTAWRTRQQAASPGLVWVELTQNPVNPMDAVTKQYADGIAGGGVDLSGYLPTSGGTMTGQLFMNNNIRVQRADQDASAPGQPAIFFPDAAAIGWFPAVMGLTIQRPLNGNVYVCDNGGANASPIATLADLTGGTVDLSGYVKTDGSSLMTAPLRFQGTAAAPAGPMQALGSLLYDDMNPASDPLHPTVIRQNMSNNGVFIETNEGLNRERILTASVANPLYVGKTGVQTMEGGLTIAPPAGSFASLSLNAPDFMGIRTATVSLREDAGRGFDLQLSTFNAAPGIGFKLTRLLNPGTDTALFVPLSGVAGVSMLKPSTRSGDPVDPNDLVRLQYLNDRLDALDGGAAPPDDFLTQQEADDRYLQLTGGTLSGPGNLNLSAPGQITPSFQLMNGSAVGFGVYSDTIAAITFFRGVNAGGTQQNIMRFSPGIGPTMDLSISNGQAKVYTDPVAADDLCRKAYVDAKTGGALMSAGVPAPDTLPVGQLALDTTTVPPSLWIGVPTSLDPTGRKQITFGSMGGTTWNDGGVISTWDGGATTWDA